MSTKLIIDKAVMIPLSELQFRFSRSGGHGGQNVNKVETRVELFFNIQHSSSLTNEQRLAITQHLKSRIDDEGNLRIIAQSSRYQWRNRQEAVEKFIALLQKALVPKKKRVATKATASSRQKRLESKKRRSTIKLSRTVREE
jgi:ribosome-associated protein